MNTPDPSLALSPPTQVRWRILALLLGYSFMSWFNRVSMAVAYDENISKQYEITTTQIGMVYSAFLLAYMVCMTPGGWLADRFGGASQCATRPGDGQAVFRD